MARQEVLRTHTTGVTIKYLADHPEPPVKAFGIDRVYRREAIDATHTPEFEQLEGIVMDRDVTFRHLLGILKEFYAKMGFEEVRFRPGYFPYTEPCVEPEVFMDGLGWVELGGAGVFRKEVTAPFGIEHPGLAWGLGVARGGHASSWGSKICGCSISPISMAAERRPFPSRLVGLSNAGCQTLLRGYGEAGGSLKGYDHEPGWP